MMYCTKTTCDTTPPSDLAASVRDRRVALFARTSMALVMAGAANAITARPAIGQSCDSPAWTRLSLTLPSARGGSGMVLDAVRQRVVLFGGFTTTNVADTFEVDGTLSGWGFVTNTGPAPRRNAMLAYDRVAARSILFGGYTNAYPADTWSYDGASWVEVSTGLSPAGRDVHALVYNESVDRTVLFGGENQSGFRGDTWEFNSAASAWVERLPRSSPSPRGYMAAAYDAHRHRVVIFGGATGPSGTLTNETWEWDGADWSQAPIPPALRPPARRLAAMAYSPERGSLFMFGGANTSDVPFNDTWEFDGTRWTRITGVGPEGRSGAMMSTDASDRVLARRWRCAATAINDAWVLSGPPVLLTQPASGLTCSGGTSTRWRLSFEARRDSLYQWRRMVYRSMPSRTLPRPPANTVGTTLTMPSMTSLSIPPAGV